VAKIGFQMDCWQGKVAFVKHVGIIDSQSGAEKFLDGQVEVMHEAGIIDDPGIVDVAETDLDGGAKNHGLVPPGCKYFSNP
jgi:hypothetical protein